MRVERALISVWDKKGVAEFAKKLESKGIEIVATEGTARELEKASVKHTKTEEITGFSSLLEGKVKTLHPLIFASILATPEEARKNKIKTFELLVVNLYPPDKEPDIGGVSLIRAGLKNWQNVAVVTDPSDYDTVALQINNFTLPDDLRDYLNRKALRYVLEYQLKNTVKYFNFDILDILFEKTLNLRYGTNPWAEAGFYFSGEPTFEVIKGEQDVSLNNIQDASSAMECVLTLKKYFPEKFCACVVKHGSPCGIALGDTPDEAVKRAFEADEKSAFGGVVALSDVVEEKTAKYLEGKFVDVVVAREFYPEAMESFVKKKTRVVRFDGDLDTFKVKFHHAFGGILVETGELPEISEDTFRPAWEFEYTKDEIDELKFALIASFFVKSNAVVITSGFRTVGIGGGAPSRVDSARIAVAKLEEYSERFGKPEKLFASSDGFFPFPDSVDVLADAGVELICQPGGSKRDKEVIERAKQKGVRMFMTGIRVFRH